VQRDRLQQAVAFFRACATSFDAKFLATLTRPANQPPTPDRGGVTCRALSGIGHLIDSFDRQGSKGRHRPPPLPPHSTAAASALHPGHTLTPWSPRPDWKADGDAGDGGQGGDKQEGNGGARGCVSAAGSDAGLPAKVLFFPLDSAGGDGGGREQPGHEEKEGEERPEAGDEASPAGRGERGLDTGGGGGGGSVNHQTCLPRHVGAGASGAGVGASSSDSSLNVESPSHMPPEDGDGGGGSGGGGSGGGMHQDLDSASSASSAEGKTPRKGRGGGEIADTVEADGLEKGASPGQIKQKGRTAKFVKVPPRHLSPCSSSAR